MGMPSINISFTEAAVASIKRSERGIVGLILKETKVPTVNPVTIINTTDIPSSISEFNKEQMKLALMGYQKAPSKILCYFITDDETVDYTDALKYFEFVNFDYLAIPTVDTDGKTEEVAMWIKSQRNNGKMCKAVLPNSTSDSEGIINYATESVTNGTSTYTSEQYCARIAGLLAGTPLTISCTYAPLSELTDCTHLSNKEMDSMIDSGKFIVFFDGEKVKVGRGVNSFTTTTEEKGDSFKKIKVVEAMDMIYADIKRTAQDSYLGKYANSYDNKCLLMNAISGYLSQLILDGVLDSATVEIDIDAQRSFIKRTGVNTDTMTNDEIKVYNTGSQVFLKSTIRILDAMEDITLSINI